ncbi:MAG: hypothetical protein KKA05_01980 [Alphaproteobacteria bacterium]|nr:hypothetical protein [Alphaproteobacteria bacterium]
MSLMIGLTAAFAVAGGLTGFGTAAWHDLQRVGCLLQGINPDRHYGPPRNPYVHGLCGIFIGAALGAGGAAGLDYTRTLIAPEPIVSTNPVTPVTTL